MDEPGLDSPLIDPIDVLTGIFGIARIGIQNLVLGRVPRLAGSFAGSTVGAAQARVIQRGGNAINNSTRKALNEFFDVNLSPGEWRDVMHALKKANAIPNRVHGNIDAVGNYLDKSGNIIDNLGNYIP